MVPMTRFWILSGRMKWSGQMRHPWRLLSMMERIYRNIWPNHAFFWFPRKDLHFCGDPNQASDELCFPTLYPLLASIHCELHICIFERSDNPAKELSLKESSLPENALDLMQCKSMLTGHWWSRQKYSVGLICLLMNSSWANRYAVYFRRDLFKWKSSHSLDDVVSACLVV